MDVAILEVIGVMSDPETTEPVLVDKAKVTSPVWTHFGLLANKEVKPNSQRMVICHLSKKRVKAKGGNTSNSQSHLKNYLPLKYAELQKL